MLLIVQLFVLVNAEFGAGFNDFPSLIIANATIGKLIDESTGGGVFNFFYFLFFQV